MTTAATLRSQVNSLTTLAANDLSALWRRLETAASAEEPLRDILPGLISVYGDAAGAVAADWYDEMRDKAGVGGRFSAIIPDQEDKGTQALVGWALAEVRKPEDVSSFRSLIEGGMQRRIADVARGTVMTSAVQDPAAEGWQRVSRGQCHGGFCDMIAARGIVFKTEDSATFGAHDHCQCVAQMAWSGREVPVKPYKVSDRRKLGPDGKPLPISDADKARVKDWIATHL